MAFTPNVVLNCSGSRTYCVTNDCSTNHTLANTYIEQYDTTTGASCGTKLAAQCICES